ncbi:MAG: hypothetical protein HY800_06330 [Ignavibacteriales bacterium]|nr:hypothetical protein [Ignavibacteriales bacterium]
MEKKRYHIVIASILFASLVWVSVNLRDEYTVVKHFPVVLENLKQGKALKYPLPKNVNVRFKGTGWSLAGLYLSPDMNYVIDLKAVSEKNFILTGKDLLEHVKLPISLQPLDVKPDTMILALDDYVEKRVPIVTNIMTSFKDGYGQVGSSRIIPESVLIGGSRNLIEHLNSWSTVFSKFEVLSTSLDIELPLEETSTHSVHLFNEVVRFKINVQPFAEKVFVGIPLYVVATPKNREVILIPPKMDVMVRGGIEQLSKLTNDDFQASVNYQDLVQDSSEIVIPKLTAPPEVNILNRKPEQFQFIIRNRLQ